MAIDLKSLSPKELQALITDANAQMQQAHAQQIQTIRQKIDALLSGNGLTLEEVYPSRGKKAPGKKESVRTVAPKYCNPSDPSQTWTGRGRQPAWFAKALRRRGVTADSLLISATTSERPAPPRKTRATKKVDKQVSKRAVARKRG